MNDVATDDISVIELLAALKRCKYWIAVSAVAFAAVGIVYSLLATPLYTAKTTVVMVDNGEGTSLLSRLPPGIASLVGNLGLTGGGGGNSKTYLAILGSRELASKFIAQEHMLPYLFPDQWDEQKHAWRKGREGLPSRLLHAAGFGGDAPERDPTPSPWRAYQKFSEIRTIQDNTATDGTVTIEFKTRDAELAAKWANSYVMLANKEIRDQVVKEASDAIEYLKKRAETTSVVGLKETIYQLVEAHLQKVTLANVQPEYAFRVIDAAVPPDARSWPNRRVIVVLAFVVGAMVGAFVGLVRDAVVQRR